MPRLCRARFRASLGIVALGDLVRERDARAYPNLFKEEAGRQLGSSAVTSLLAGQQEARRLWTATLTDGTSQKLSGMNVDFRGIVASRVWPRQRLYTGFGRVVAEVGEMRPGETLRVYGWVERDAGPPTAPTPRGMRG